MEICQDISVELLKTKDKEKKISKIMRNTTLSTGEKKKTNGSRLPLRNRDGQKGVAQHCFKELQGTINPEFYIQ